MKVFKKLVNRVRDYFKVRMGFKDLIGIRYYHPSVREADPYFELYSQTSPNQTSVIVMTSDILGGKLIGRELGMYKVAAITSTTMMMKPLYGDTSKIYSPKDFEFLEF